MSRQFCLRLLASVSASDGKTLPLSTFDVVRQSRRRNAVDAIMANSSDLLCMIVTDTVPDATEKQQGSRQVEGIAVVRS